MCWTGKNICRIATEPIDVWKVANLADKDRFRSLYKPFTYEIGKEYHTSFSFDYYDCDDNHKATIYEGFHSYSKGLGIKRNEFVHTDIVTRNGSSVDMICSHEKKDVYIGLFRIPKGSFYYINDDGHIVSTAIVLRSIYNQHLCLKPHYPYGNPDK